MIAVADEDGDAETPFGATLSRLQDRSCRPCPPGGGFHGIVLVLAGGAGWPTGNEEAESEAEVDVAEAKLEVAGLLLPLVLLRLLLTLAALLPPSGCTCTDTEELLMLLPLPRVGGTDDEDEVGVLGSPA